MLLGITEAATGLLTSRIQAFYSKYASRNGGGLLGRAEVCPWVFFCWGGGKEVDYIYYSSE